MVLTLAALLPLVLAAVLVIAGVSKIRSRERAEDWAELGVPGPLRQPWLLKSHPWLELALALSLAALGGLAGVLAGAAATILMGSYTWLLVRAVRHPSGATCSCFGVRERVTGITIARNVWLLGLAATTTLVIGNNPLLGGALRRALSEPEWLVVLLAVGMTAILLAWPSRSSESEDDLLDYERVRTPAVPVTLGDRTRATLRELTRERPLLLLAVSEVCGYCEAVVASVPAWREVLPEVDVRLLLTTSPGSSGWSESAHPASVHDPQEYVRQSIHEWGTPTAILFGADGLLAGGPVTGDRAIPAFIAEIRAALDEAAAAASHSKGVVTERHASGETPSVRR